MGRAACAAPGLEKERWFGLKDIEREGLIFTPFHDFKNHTHSNKKHTIKI
jgi:hypothetical protein